MSGLRDCSGGILGLKRNGSNPGACVRLLIIALFDSINAHA
jgi:hypothetical protein